jgi:hypothetical protein
LPRELFRKKYLLAGVLLHRRFDEHRVSLQWPAQKDRISVFRAAVGVCSGGAVSGDFSLEDFMVTTAPSILNLSTVSVYIWKLM